MRKVDYRLLAQIIRQMAQVYDRATLVQLAHNFANRSSVNRELFLKECGL